MSENKHTSGMPDEPNQSVPQDREPPLSELISSTMESVGKKKQPEAESKEKDEEKTIVAPKLGQFSKTDRSDVPEISFKKQEQKAEKPQPPKAAEKKPPEKEIKKDADKNAAQKSPKSKPDQPAPKEKAKKSGGNSAVKQSSPAKKPSKTNSANSKKAASDNAAKDPPAKSRGGEKSPEKSAKQASPNGAKNKFTKKQAATVAGLILSLLLVLALIVVLIFNHYYNKMDTSALNDSTNSAQMTYSDVDLSRADTLDKAAEDEKLQELSQEGEKISDKDVMNILLIGEDLRDTQNQDAGNTDVMMIISINTKDKTITMTSIMRDCYVSYQDENGYWWSNRINAAYWTGGISLTKQTIENYMNVKIDRYVLVNFKVFIDIVDTLGGIDMYVSDEEANGYPDADPNGDNTRGMQNPLDEQNKYLGNKKGTDYIKKGGNLHLNGNQALAYARLRHVGNSDYERTERQRKVIAEMIKESRSMSIVDMDKLANKILPQIKTDVTKSEAAQLIVDMLDYRNYEIQEFRVPAEGTYTNQIISGMDVLSVDFNANAEQFRKLVYGTIVLDENGEEKKKTIE